jgi:hypothetical protein
MTGIGMVAAAFLAFAGQAEGGPWQAPGEGSIGMALVEDALWVADRKEGKAFALDPEDGSTKRSLDLPCREAGGLAGTKGTLWCTEVVQSLLFAIDLETGKTVQRVEAPCDYPGAAAFVDGQLWIHCPFERKISVTDPADGTTTKWLPAPCKRLSALGSGNGLALAADREKDRIYLLDPKVGAVMAVLPLESPFVTGLAFDGKTLFAADYQADRIVALDLDSIPPLTVESSKNERVLFTHHLLAGGPEPLTDVEVFVALPEERATQKIISLAPFPEGAVMEEVSDKEGQRYWKFKMDELPAGQEAVFGYRADVEIRQVRWFADPRRKAAFADIPKEIRERYLGDRTKYRVGDPLVVETARKIAGKEENPHLLFQKTYRYVLDNMDYSLSGGWNAAPLLLERKTGSCSEYTILLVSLLRAAGIPARYVGSLVMRGEQASVDLVFHRWAEVYLPGLGWVPVDANKGDTEWPADQAEGFAFQEGVFLITTAGSGDSDILGWGYNSVARYKQSGAAEVREWSRAEWEPAETKAEPGAAAPEKTMCP